jgi:hypothetical protein
VSVPVPVMPVLRVVVVRIAGAGGGKQRASEKKENEKFHGWDVAAFCWFTMFWVLIICCVSLNCRFVLVSPSSCRLGDRTAGHSE